MKPKKLSEQELIHLLHAANSNRLDENLNSNLAFLLSRHTKFSRYSIDELFWLTQLANVLARNHDKRGLQLVQKLYTDRVLFKLYGQHTPGTSTLGTNMRSILGEYGDHDILNWLEHVEGRARISRLYPYPTSPLRVEMNKIAFRLGRDPGKTITKAQLEYLLAQVKGKTLNGEDDRLLSALVSDQYNLADIVVDGEEWILLSLADALGTEGDPRAKALLCKMCQDRIPGSGEFGDYLEFSILAYGGVEGRTAWKKACNPTLIDFIRSRFGLHF